MYYVYLLQLKENKSVRRVKLTAIKSHSCVESHCTESDEQVRHGHGDVKVVSKYSEFPMSHHGDDHKHVSNDCCNYYAYVYQSFHRVEGDLEKSHVSIYYIRTVFVHSIINTRNCPVSTC